MGTSNRNFTLFAVCLFNPETVACEVFQHLVCNDVWWCLSKTQDVFIATHLGPPLCRNHPSLFDLSLPVPWSFIVSRISMELSLRGFYRSEYSQTYDTPENKAAGISLILQMNWSLRPGHMYCTIGLLLRLPVLLRGWDHDGRDGGGMMPKPPQ